MVGTQLKAIGKNTKPFISFVVQSNDAAKDTVFLQCNKRKCTY